MLQDSERDGYQISDTLRGSQVRCDSRGVDETYVSNRKFDLYLFWVSHGLLLLRSGRVNGHAMRIDIQFRDVIWMSIPAWMNGLAIEDCPVEDVCSQLPATLRTEATLRQALRLTTGGVPFYVICGSMCIAEDDHSYFEPSSLIPDLTVTQTFDR